MPEPRSLKYRAWCLLRDTPRPTKEIAKAIGTSTAWVRMFANDEIKDPGVNTIQKLYEYLSGEPIFKD